MLLALVSVLGLLLAACGADDIPVSTGPGGTGSAGSTTPVTTVPEPIPEGAEGLDAARERWDAAGIADYSMTYREICFCPQTVVTVTVEDGEVVDTIVEQDPELGRPMDGLSVDDLFAEIQEAVDTDAAEIEATYDDSTGRPTRFYIDQSTMMADEEHGIEVTEFTAAGEPSTPPSSPSPSPPSSDPGGVDETGPSVVTTGTSLPPLIRTVAQAELSEPWGCGYGFVATDPSHFVALALRSDVPVPVGSSTITLPAPGWVSEVQVGYDLFTVACADLDQQRPPTPDDRWPVVAGTLQITVPESMGCGGGSVATAVATGLTIETSDGSTIGFPELTLVNDQWGCFAG
jgi:hypothetical protein